MTETEPSTEKTASGAESPWPLIVLRSPCCHRPLVEHETALNCEDCGKYYRRQDGMTFLLAEAGSICGVCGAETVPMPSAQWPGGPCPACGAEPEIEQE